MKLSLSAAFLHAVLACGCLQSGTVPDIQAGQSLGKVGHTAYGPQYPLFPKAVECVVICLIPLLLLVCARGKPGLWAAERTLKTTQVLQEMFTHPQTKPQTDAQN